MNKNFYIFLSFITMLFANCTNSDLSEALYADKYGNTSKAIKYLNKYLDENNNSETIDTSNDKINTLQAKKLVASINSTIDSEKDSLSADDYRKFFEKIERYKSWDPEDVVFGLTKAKINEQLNKITLECQSLENVLNIFITNNEKLKAYKTYNFIKEKDSKFNVAPLTEIKIIDIFIDMNEKHFYKKLANKDFEQIIDFFNLIDEQFFSEEHKQEIKERYYKSLKKIVLPHINTLIKQKYFLNAFIINNETIKDNELNKTIKKELKNTLLKNKKNISHEDFIILEGYLITYPMLKKYVENEYYSKVDNVSLPETAVAIQLNNHKLRKDIYNDIKISLKEEIRQNTIPIIIKNSSKKDIQYLITIDTSEILDDKLDSKIAITRLKPKKENIINQSVSTRFDITMQEISTHKLVRKIMYVIRENIKLDIETMLKSARYYLVKKDLKQFRKITLQLILLNQLEPFSDIYKNKFIKLLSEYEKYGK